MCALVGASARVPVSSISRDAGIRAATCKFASVLSELDPSRPPSVGHGACIQSADRCRPGRRTSSSRPSHPRRSRARAAPVCGVPAVDANVQAQLQVLLALVPRSGEGVDDAIGEPRPIRADKACGRGLPEPANCENRAVSADSAEPARGPSRRRGRGGQFDRTQKVAGRVAVMQKHRQASLLGQLKLPLKVPAPWGTTSTAPTAGPSARYTNGAGRADWRPCALELRLPRAEM